MEDSNYGIQVFILEASARISDSPSGTAGNRGHLSNRILRETTRLTFNSSFRADSAADTGLTLGRQDVPHCPRSARNRGISIMSMLLFFTVMSPSDWNRENIRLTVSSLRPR